MIAEVIVDVVNSEVDKIFDYIVPTAKTVPLGAKVVVPFGNRKIEGYVIGLKKTSEYPQEKLKEIFSIKQDIVLSKEMLELARYLKNKFYLKTIDCIRLMLPTVIRQEKMKHLQVHYITLNPNDNVITEFLGSVRANAKQQIGCVKFLQTHGVLNQIALNKKFGAGAVNKLLSLGVLQTKSQVKYRNPLDWQQDDEKMLQLKQENIVLNKYQQQAVQEILQAKDQTFLLHGVTGSGKTEVYMQVIDHMLKQGKTAIMLVPEIGLTPQMTMRMTARFGNQIAVLHSGLSEGERHDEWLKLYQGKAHVVVGARSAIFAPLKNVGVIIIDEEHDNSYVSDSNPRYQTVDVAEFRSKYNHAPLILGSATPTIEHFYEAKQGNFKLLSLPVRVNGADLPPVEIVDMLPEFRSGNKSPFSKVLLTHLQNTIVNKKQAMLFINRRGFSSFLMCRDCGYIPKCEACDVSLVYHKHDHELKCHYCGKRYKVITTCPVCNSKNIKLGGIGTERVVAELKELFPSVPIFRMDNDTTTNKNAHYKILKDFETHKPSILVGTQMIAKGHDFPHVTLVGILDADLSLYFGSYKASENTFQLITQVSGRAGRSDFAGHVVLQTYYPKHYVYKLASNYNYDKFYEKEINLREVTMFPPFSHFMRILVSSVNDASAKDVAHELFMRLKELRQKYDKQFLFLEAMRAPVGRIKGKYRYQVVLRFVKKEEILQQIHAICDTMKRKDVLIFVESNPQSLS